MLRAAEAEAQAEAARALIGADMGPDVNSATSPVHGARNHKGCTEVAKRKAPDLFVQVRGSETLDINYSHSIVAIVLCVLPCVISCHLVRLFSSSPNHFVIRWVITNHRIPDSNADSCDDSLATIPDFVNGNSIGRFAVRRFGQNRHSYSLGDFL